MGVKTSTRPLVPVGSFRTKNDAATAARNYGEGWKPCKVPGTDRFGIVKKEG